MKWNINECCDYDRTGSSSGEERVEFIIVGIPMGLG